MAKLCSEQIYFEAEKGSKEGSIQVKFDIHVNQSGEFTTTLPKDVVAQLEYAQIDLSTNRNGTAGYFSSQTKEGLIKKVSDVAKEYVSRELISDKLVIQYSIETVMSYQMSVDGKVFPNGAFGGGTGWKSGTKDISASSAAPYGIKVYAGIYKKEVWKYRSGIEKTTSEGYWGSNNLPYSKEECPNLHWLANLTCMASVGRWGGESMKVSEMDYTEENAKFFVDFISALCLLNEKILPIISDQNTLMEFISSQQKLIG